MQTLMEHGSRERATAQTGANDTSSRSHAVFIIAAALGTPLSDAHQSDFDFLSQYLAAGPSCELAGSGFELNGFEWF